MKRDLHVHTNFSADSTETMENYCITAIKLELDCICFTDHVDHHPDDFGLNFYKASDYFDEYNRIKDKYNNKLTVLSGIEFAEPHIYRKEFDQFLKYPYDFIIGSLHWWYGNLFPSEMVKQNVSAEDCYDKYWIEMYSMVSYGGFDCVGHFDFPKRYYKTLLYNDADIKDIFAVMAKNNLCLEINTSSLRRGLNENMPNYDVLKLYDGEYYTAGSDSHFADELYSDIDKINLPDKQQIYFKERKIIL